MFLIYHGMVLEGAILASLHHLFITQSLISSWLGTCLWSSYDTMLVLAQMDWHKARRASITQVVSRQMGREGKESNYICFYVRGKKQDGLKVSKISEIIASIQLKIFWPFTCYQTTCRLLYTIILLIPLYGEIWSLIWRDKSRGCNRTGATKDFKPDKEQVTRAWQKLHNKELQAL